ncbi:wax ester/triacylglycerol synthase domain-containing protein [Streptomyces syringium]|uniref:wax ester/triacylglycerol synthase domain-containing protein n=1 Tax=Streptomyces syringium TaxID=76729 RepID=UPI0036A8099A
MTERTQDTSPDALADHTTGLPRPRRDASGPQPAPYAAGIAMSPLDAWFHGQQSGEHLCMTAGLLAWFEGPPPPLAELRERVRRRWGALPRLRLMPPAASPAAAWPRWTPGPEFDTAAHVTAGPDGGHATPETATALLLARPLAPVRPPWQLHLLPSPGGFALLIRVHHALLDGTSMVTLLRSLLDASAAPLPGSAARRAHAPSLAPTRRALTRALTDVLPKARPLPFHGPVDARRVLSCERVPKATLSAARDALPSGRASTNAVFLAATAAALRTAGLAGRRPGLPGVCAMVPVDVRTAEDADVLGNHYATIRVPLPTHRRAARRLAAVDSFTRRAALQGRAQAQALLVSRTRRGHGRLTDALGRYVASPLYSSLLCSSLATYAGPLALGAAPLVAVSALPTLSTGHPVAVTMSLHDANAVVTVVTDHQHRNLAPRLSGLIHDEIHALRL